MLGAQLLAEGDQARAERAVARRSTLGDRRDGGKHGKRLGRPRWPRQAMRLRSAPTGAAATARPRETVRPRRRARGRAPLRDPGDARLGPAGRSFANAAAILDERLDPPSCSPLKEIERASAAAAAGAGARACSISTSSSGRAAPGESRARSSPTPDSGRSFVLEPLAEIAPDWRDPLTGLTVRQLLHRLARPSPVDRRATPS
jgi:2-amino-4-hydroxy-6-hydroxymethyldihydropteridine diphosphokinase